MLGATGGYTDNPLLLLDDDEYDPRKADDEYYGQTFEIGRQFYNASRIIGNPSETVLTNDATIDVNLACNALAKADHNAYPLLRDGAREVYLTFVKNGEIGHRPRPVLASIAVLLASRQSDIRNMVPAILFTDIVHYLATVEGYKSMDYYAKPHSLIKISEKLYGSKDIPHADLDALLERLLVRCCCWSRACAGPQLFDMAKARLMCVGDDLDKMTEGKRCGVVGAAVIDACEECEWKYKNNGQIMEEMGLNRSMLYKYRNLLPPRRNDSIVVSSASNKKRRRVAKGFGVKSIEKRKKCLNIDSRTVGLSIDDGTKDLTIELDDILPTLSNGNPTRPTLAAPPSSPPKEDNTVFNMDDFFV
ncbi:hypothetical protein FOL47_005967 [Perkinsus chesapeaki]|uniref:Uncharacterized protein n=1 Tax=Perkinsus chesapeaki TaxID=330153 RepID=A0A7J6N090_PERCH|nr:hypothetical protein FOL47_005967 [Perkinsus chesapeaki]